MTFSDGDERPATAMKNRPHDRMSARQYVIVLCCLLVVIFDGMDTAAIGFVAPALAAEFRIARSQIGPILSAALFGMAAGSFVVGPLADRLGRKPILVGAVSIFGVCTLVCSLVHSLYWLTVLRFLTGLGLGGALPCASTLLAEYVPANRRSLFVNLLYCGFPLGASAGGFIAAHLIPNLGWPSVFVLGGTMPLLLAFGLLALPESISFMRAKNWPVEKINRVMNWMPAAEQSAISTLDLEKRSSDTQGGIRMILGRPFAFGTLMLWTGFFMGLLVFYLMINWLPTILQEARFSVRESASIVAFMPLGGVFGSVVCGWLLDRFAPTVMTMCTYAIGAISLWIAGAAIASGPVLIGALFVGGFFLLGSQASMVSLAMRYYPTPCRATGDAWMIGVGRAGGILGAIIGIPLLHLQIGPGEIISTLAIPTFVSAIAVGFMRIPSVENESPTAETLHETA
jgi:AAHS family 4-hydroxybenzoate transporter-like MFS transporter